MPQPPAPGRRASHFTLVTVVCLLVACALAALLAAYGADQHLESLTLPVCTPDCLHGGEINLSGHPALHAVSK